MTDAGKHDFQGHVLEEYVLGRLAGDARAEIEAAIDSDPELRDQVTNLRAEAEQLADALARGADAAHGPADDEILDKKLLAGTLLTAGPAGGPR